MRQPREMSAKASQPEANCRCEKAASDRLLFEFVSPDKSSGFAIRSEFHSNLPTTAWKQLATRIRNEESVTLRPCDSHRLRARWEDGLAAVLLHRDRIISYSSLESIMLGRIMDGPPPCWDVYEFRTGWTDPEYRRKGLSFWLRRQLLDARCDGTLVVSLCRGVGAGPVLSKLGWKTIAWDRYPFVSSLVGWFSERGFYRTSVGEMNLALEPRSGEHFQYRKANNAFWKRYLQLWCSDVPIATRLEQHFRKVHVSVQQWRMRLKSKLGDSPSMAGLDQHVLFESAAGFGGITNG